MISQGKNQYPWRLIFVVSKKKKKEKDISGDYYLYKFLLKMVFWQFWFFNGLDSVI